MNVVHKISVIQLKSNVGSIWQVKIYSFDFFTTIELVSTSFTILIISLGPLDRDRRYENWWYEMTTKYEYYIVDGTSIIILI